MLISILFINDGSIKVYPSYIYLKTVHEINAFKFLQCVFNVTNVPYSQLTLCAKWVKWTSNVHYNRT